MRTKQNGRDFTIELSDFEAMCITKGNEIRAKLTDDELYILDRGRRTKDSVDKLRAELVTKKGANRVFQQKPGEEPELIGFGMSR